MIKLPSKYKYITAYKFNEYVVNVGPLANKIPLSDTSYLAYMKGNFRKSFGPVGTKMPMK